MAAAQLRLEKLFHLAAHQEEEEEEDWGKKNQSAARNLPAVALLRREQKPQWQKHLSNLNVLETKRLLFLLPLLLGGKGAALNTVVEDVTICR